MTVLECANLSRWYGNVIAVNDVTVEMQAGVIGFLGPNGAGKSTFMKMAVGLLKPSAGRIRVLDENPWNNTKLLGRIGYVPEGDAPWRDRSGREAAITAGQLSGLSRATATEAADRALAQVGLTAQAEKQVDAYSRGMRQKLKFALALLHEPELLILDEPLLGSDPLTRRDLIQLIRKLGDQGKTVIVSTHVLADVEAMTQRILLLNHGRLMAYGEVSEIRNLLEKYPRTIRDATPDAKALGTQIWQWDSVLSLQHEEGGLLVHTRTPQTFYSQLQEHILTTKANVTSVSSTDDSVEAVFRYLVG
jgi:ABC-2 type transport system ATP-binding protein